MSLNVRLSIALPTILLSSILGWATSFSPAIAAPYDQFAQHCKPKLAGTHDCLEPVPAYSYHLGLRSNYSGELCLDLGDWEGDNQVVVEWDGLQTTLQLSGKVGIQQHLQPEQREGRSSAIVVYSDQPIMPQLIERDCGLSREVNQVTLMAWPQVESETNNVAQVPEEDSQASSL